MKILFTSTYFPPYREPFLRLLNEDDRLKVSFLLGDRVLTPGLKRANDTSLTDVKALRNVWFASKIPGGPFLWQRNLIKHVLRTDADIVLFTGDWHHLSTWIAAAIARLRRKKTVFHTIGWMGKVGLIENLVKKPFYSLASSLFLYGERAQAFALEHGYSPNRIEVVYNSVLSLPKESGLRGLEDISTNSNFQDVFENSDSPTVICVSRLEPKRRLDLLIRAAGTLSRAGRPINVLLVGVYERDAGQALRTLAVEEGVNISLPGAIFDGAHLAFLYAKSSCTVMPAAAGLAVTQALAHGTPAVTCEDWNILGPEVEALQPGDTGVFYNYGDVESLANAIEECLGLAAAEGTHEKCVEQVRKKYTPEAQAAAFVRGFASLMSVRSARPTE